MKLPNRFLIRLFALLVWRGIDLLVAEAGPRQLVLGQGGMSGEITNVSASLAAGSAAERPNIIFILADD
jgi:hypothetical protein